MLCFSGVSLANVTKLDMLAHKPFLPLYIKFESYLKKYDEVANSFTCTYDGKWTKRLLARKGLVSQFFFSSNSQITCYLNLQNELILYLWQV